MFTGIVTDVGEVVSLSAGALKVRTGFDGAAIPMGASIAFDGCCLSVHTIEMAKGEPGSHVSVDVSGETLSKTTIGSWQPGRAVNLERALTAGTELGGHFVTGHVDGLGQILEIQNDGASLRFEIAAPETMARFIAPKGSVALDGISLTVNEVHGAHFGVNLIPLTLTSTTWGRKKPGDMINIEVDLIARYIARLMEVRP